MTIAPKRIALKDGSTRWVGRLSLGRDPVTGKRVQRLVTAATRRAWEDAAAKARAEAIGGGGSRAGTDIALGDFLVKHWLPDKEADGRIGPASAHQYAATIRLYLVPALGHVKLGKLRPADIQAFYTALSGRLGPATVARIHAVLNAALGHAVRLELIPRNPCAAVRPPRAPTPDVAVWSLAQARAFLAGIGDDPDRALWLVLVLGGLRVGEAIALTWDDVDLAAGRLTVRATLTRNRTGAKVIGERAKSRAGHRRVDLPPDAITALSELPSRDVGGLVFPGCFGQPWNQETISNRLKAICRRLGLPVVSVHKLRHVHGTSLMLAGVPQKVAMARLGHASPRMTLHYSHVAGDEQKAAAEAVAAVLMAPERAQTAHVPGESPVAAPESA
jgi:integrase